MACIRVRTMHVYRWHLMRSPIEGRHDRSSNVIDRLIECDCRSHLLVFPPLMVNCDNRGRRRADIRLCVPPVWRLTIKCNQVGHRQRLNHPNVWCLWRDRVLVCKCLCAHWICEMLRFWVELNQFLHTLVFTFFLRDSLQLRFENYARACHRRDSHMREMKNQNQTQ